MNSLVIISISILAGVGAFALIAKRFGADCIP
jgi:hypothetical protein